MKIRSTLAVFVLMVAQFSVLPARGADENPEPFFPIMAWGGVPDDPAVLKKMKDCGINVAGLAFPKQLDALQAVGMKALVNDPRALGYDWQNVDEATAKKNVESLAAETAKHPAVLGYYMLDEPHTVRFDGLGKVAALFHQFAPKAIPFINLLPNYATTDQLGAKTYDEYLDAFVKKCNPSIISYDNYSLLDDGTLRDGYFQNLESVRKAALNHKIPFWNIVLSVGHFSYRPPSRADFAFQVYTTLACGGRGIVYFTYFAPHVGNYRLAPIDQFGNETETWRYMQFVNLQVLKLAPLMMKLRSDDVYHIGKVPHDCHGPSAKSLIKDIKSGDYLVGDFTKEDDGSRYVMIVNKDVFKSHYLNEITYTQPAGRVKVISPYGGEDFYEGEQCVIAPGQGVLLQLPMK